MTSLYDLRKLYGRCSAYVFTHVTKDLNLIILIPPENSYRACLMTHLVIGSSSSLVYTKIYLSGLLTTQTNMVCVLAIAVSNKNQ